MSGRNCVGAIICVQIKCVVFMYTRHLFVNVLKVLSSQVRLWSVLLLIWKANLSVFDIFNSQPS